MEFLALGPVEVRDGTGVVDLGGPTSQAIVASLLAHAGTAISQDRLADAHWPDSDRGVATLHTYVSRIRKSLGPAGPEIVERQGDGYVLRTGGNSDAERFQDLLTDADSQRADGDLTAAAGLLDAALGLWRGAAFSGHEHDELVAAEAHRLDERRLIAQEIGLELALQRGEHRAIVPEIERLSDLHPLRERLWELRIEALAGAGRQAEALRAFQDARVRLAEELGIEPSASLRDLERRVLEQDPALRPRVSEPAATRAPSPLPSSPTKLIGRDDDVVGLTRMLGEERLVTLVGFGGVGKTRLAIEGARAATPRFPAGVRMVDLSGEVDPDAVSPTIAAEAASLAAAPGRGLLIVDNCEHLIDSCAAAISDELARNSDLVVLATSREALRVPWEHRWPVEPLRVPTMETAHDELSTSPAVRLFVDRASAVRPSMTLDDQDLVDIADICRLVEGVPLSIELAASRTGAMGLRDVIDGLRDRGEPLAGGYRTSARRHRSLENVLEWSYRLLDEDERWLLGGLRTMLVSFPARAAEVVFSSESRSGPQVLEVLHRLVDRSLVRVDEADGAAMYSLMMTVRGFIYDRSGWQNDFDRRGFVLDLAQHTPIERRGSPAEMWSALLDGPIDIAQRTLDVAYESHDVEAGSFLAGLVAARASEAGRVGFVGGVRWPYLERFEHGFRAGVAHADASVDAAVDYISVAPDFSGFGARTETTRTKATALFQAGVDVLYHGAGPFGGQGILLAAQAWEEATGRRVRVIGVDHDERVMRAPALQPYVITSMRRAVPIDAYRELKAAVATGAEELPRLDLANGGIFMSRTGGEIEHLVDELESVTAGIIDGTIATT